MPSPAIKDLEDLRFAKRTGDINGNAPMYCCSTHQYMSPGVASIFSKFTPKQIRLAYIRFGLTYCRKCKGWT
jgi:hypothetical protein